MQNNKVVESNKQTTKLNNNKMNFKQKIPTYVYALGGVGEVGKNMYVFEHDDELFIVDVGIMFGKEVNLSIDGIIPSFEALKSKESKIKGILITHGHEDHIGALPYIVNQLKIPIIYAPKLALELIKVKFKLRETKYVSLKEIDGNQTLRSKHFTINYFRNNHSIPDSYGIVLKTTNGTIVTTGDFKFDFSPISQPADFYKMAKLGEEGVTLFLADSTNSLIPGFTNSESEVVNSIEHIFNTTKGRLILATFASNVWRLHAIIEIAKRFKRKLLIFGLSMEKIIQISIQIKYIDIPKDMIIEAKEANKYKDNELLILCTGSQGEPMAALSRIANDEHKQIAVKKGDTVIFSSSPIPGNFIYVQETVNKLVKKGVIVLENKTIGTLHTSGHASQEEQKLMHSLIKPQYFFPIHGEYRMLLQHAKTAMKVVPNLKRVFIGYNGMRLKMINGVVEESGSVVAGDVFIDGKDSNGYSEKVIQDRLQLAKNGIAIIVIGLDPQNNKIIRQPKLIVKGCFNYYPTNPLIIKIEKNVEQKLEEYLNTNKVTFNGIKELIRSLTKQIIFNEKKQSPIIVPVIISKFTNEQLKISGKNKSNKIEQNK